ncbi:hypothetical protein MKW92_053559 [Papaver armeniacum]|nr:hypothetical protein MKW92_053559 [Papaver armeniacum]
MEVRNNVGSHNGIDMTTTTTSPPSQHQNPLPSPNNNSKHIKPSSKPVDTNSVTLRLQKELMSLMNIFSWIGTIQGGKGTPYEDLSYKLSLRFPLDYPFKAPSVKFDTMCFHPNVDQYGNICLDILQDKWSSAYDCRTILISIQSLLGESSLNSYAASLWNNQEDYKKIVRKQFMDETEFES